MEDERDAKVEVPVGISAESLKEHLWVSASPTLFYFLAGVVLNGC